MKNTIDVKALRIFPYMILVMIISIMLAMLSPLIRMLTSGDVAAFNLNFMNADLFMMCYFLIYISILWVFSCLYSLMGVSKWFSLSCTMTAGYIMSEIVSYVVKWIAETLGRPQGLMILWYFTRIMPTLFIMCMFSYFMYGAAEKYKEMGKEKRCVFMKKLIFYWIAAFITQVFLTIMVNLYVSNDRAPFIYCFLACCVYLYNFSVMIVMFINVRRFCYDFYLYSYNKGIL